MSNFLTSVVSYPIKSIRSSVEKKRFVSFKKCVISGEFEDVVRLLEKHPHFVNSIFWTPHTPWENYRTLAVVHPLHLAVGRKNLDIVKVLIPYEYKIESLMGAEYPFSDNIAKSILFCFEKYKSDKDSAMDDVEVQIVTEILNSLKSLNPKTYCEFFDIEEIDREAGDVLLDVEKWVNIRHNMFNTQVLEENASNNSQISQDKSMSILESLMENEDQKIEVIDIDEDDVLYGSLDEYEDKNIKKFKFL